MTGHSWSTGAEPQGACMSFQLCGCRVWITWTGRVFSPVPESSVAGSMQSLWPHNNPGLENRVTWKYRTVWEARWVISLLLWDGCTQNTDRCNLKIVHFCAIFRKINYCYRSLDCIALDCIMCWKVKGVLDFVGFINTVFVCYHNCISVALKIILKIEWVPCWKGGAKIYFYLHSHLLGTAAPLNTELCADMEMLKLYWHFLLQKSGIKRFSKFPLTLLPLGYKSEENNY